MYTWICWERGEKVSNEILMRWDPIFLFTFVSSERWDVDGNFFVGAWAFNFCSGGFDMDEYKRLVVKMNYFALIDTFKVEEVQT